MTKFANALSQFEQTLGKPRADWTLEDWRRAALSLEQATAQIGALLEEAIKFSDKATKKNENLSQQLVEGNSRYGKAIQKVAEILDSGWRPKRKRGRPPLQNVSCSTPRQKQPLIERHKNFGSNKKHSSKYMLVLLTAIAAKKKAAGTKTITQQEAIFGLLESFPQFKGKRRSVLMGKAKSISSSCARYKATLQSMCKDVDVEEIINRSSDAWVDRI